MEEQLLENEIFQRFCCFQQDPGPPGCTVAGCVPPGRLPANLDSLGILHSPVSSEMGGRTTLIGTSRTVLHFQSPQPGLCPYDSVYVSAARFQKPQVYVEETSPSKLLLDVEAVGGDVVPREL